MGSRQVEDERAIAEVRAVVYRMAERYGSKDVDGVLETFVDNPLLVGTGEDELRFGGDSVRLQIARDVSEPDQLSYSVDKLHVDVFGDAAFAFADAVVNASFGDDGFRFPVRSTFGLVRTNAGWRIAQVHTSAAHRQQPQGRSFPVNLTKTLSNLLTAIDDDAGASVLNSETLGTATILFTDIVDSTVMSQSMGDREWSRLITSHFDSTRRIVEGTGGTVVKTLGDGGMFVFSSGTSALLAAIEVQQAVTSTEGDPISIRVGVHTGDVVQDRNDYIGLTVNKAARVAAAAQGGQILISATTADIVNHSDLALGETIAVELKGLEGTHILTPLEWADNNA